MRGKDGPAEFVSGIKRESAEHIISKTGMEVTAVIHSTELLLVADKVVPARVQLISPVTEVKPNS